MASRSTIEKHYEKMLISLLGESIPFTYTDFTYFNHSFNPELEMAPVIFEVIMAKDLGILKRLVQCGVNLNTFDSSGNSQLHVAASWSSEEILEYLLSVDRQLINRQNILKQTPLHAAISEENFDAARLLILAGADVNISNSISKSPLQLAVGKPEIVSLLIQYGADIENRDVFNNTALHCATQANCLETIFMLLYYNADANVMNTSKYTPFIYAIENRNEEIQEALFEYVYDYDSKYIFTEMSVLGLAIIYNSPFVDEMICRGADLDNVDQNENGGFFLVLKTSRSTSNVNVKAVKLVWERMKCKPIEIGGFLEILTYLHTSMLLEIVDIFIESDNSFVNTQESVSKFDDLDIFSLRCIDQNLSLEKYTTFMCKLLTYGYSPNQDDIEIVYNRWGYCELFKILLQMDIRNTDSYRNINRIPIRLMYDVKYGRKKLIHYLARKIKADKLSTCDRFTLAIFSMLDYFIDPTLKQAYCNMMKTDCVVMKIRALPKVPSLLELARNETRDHIQKFYAVTTSSQLYTLINTLDIATVYKKILTLETVIYKPAFTKQEFERCIKLLKMSSSVGLHRINSLIQTTFKNSTIK